MPASTGHTPQPSFNASQLWFGAALFLVAAKLWLVSGQTVYAIGGSIHDDKLFVSLAEHLIYGRWLGPYDQFTLAKGPLYSFFIAANFWLGLPILISQQLLYIGACVALTTAFHPWLKTAGQRFALFAVLLLNPMSWDASNLTRLLRQSIYVPLGMLVVAGLVVLYTHRRASPRRLAIAAGAAGLAYGAFWLTREESIWLLPTIVLCWSGTLFSIRQEWREHWRAHAVAAVCFFVAFALPIFAISWQNYRHYGWFGTVEFRAQEFKDAYGALTRIDVGPELKDVIVTRQMREAAYQVSPTFARLRFQFEEGAGAQWFDPSLLPVEEKQIRGGWFMWALRDAHFAAGLAPDAGTAMRNYAKIAAEINAACNDGRLPARPARSGFFPRLTRKDIEPIWRTTLEYIDYFGAFRGFTAWSPDSVGDYADLKPFRDYTATRLSYAPRSPQPPPPNQARLQRLQISTLELTGRFLAGAIAWTGPFFLLIGIARGLQCLWQRRLPYLLGLAGALLVSVAAYLAANILITVSAFRNVSPGAMAAAYPLYLLALFAIAADAIPAWSRGLRPTPMHAAGPMPSRWRWLVPAGAAVIVWAARLREIHLFGGDLPFNDQWIVEAQKIILPWLDGQLRPWAFLLPHFEHLPVWTRLLTWIEVALTGRWDPLLQMTVNTTLYATFSWLIARRVWQSFTPLTAGFITMILVLGGALPHAWENMAWGFQSQVPIGLLLAWWHIHDSLVYRCGSRRWWAAQIAGLAALFTLASMWLAPLAVVAAYAWTRAEDARSWRVPAFIAGAGFLLLALTHIFADHAFAQNSSSLINFVHSGLHLLSWPSGLPGAGAILLLPWLLHALRLRNTIAAPVIDRVIFALGLFSVMQAGGLAFARAGDFSDYVSRYGDILFTGTLAGAMALVRIAPPADNRRSLWIVLAFAWSGLVAGGIWQHATEGHARYFHEHAADNAHIRRIAVQAYLQDRDASLLEQGGTRWVFTQNTDVVTSLLDRPDFRSLLPASVNAANIDNAPLRLTRWLLDNWDWMLVAGIAILGAGLIVIRYRGNGVLSLCSLSVAPAHWLLRLAVITSAISFAGVVFWSHPIFNNRDARWRQLLGGSDAIQGMTFHFSDKTGFPDDRIQGAAPVRPIELRNRLYGTAPAGPALTCTVFSSPFTVTKDWLVIPYAGYPVGVGNGLRVQVLSPDRSRVEREIECLPPNLDRLGFCAVDLKPVRGRSVRLVLYDGRVDTEAWVAAAPPIPCDSPELSTSLAKQVEFEQHSSLPVSFFVIGLLALSGVFVIRRVGSEAGSHD